MSGARNWRLVANVTLTVVAIAVGVALGVWPSAKPVPPAPAPQAIPATSPSAVPSEPVTPSETALPQETVAPAPPAVAEVPAGPTAPAVNPLPGTPGNVVVTVVQENIMRLRVSVSWKVGSGNGRAITGHRVALRTDRGESLNWETGAGGGGDAQEILCSGRVCDGIRLTAEVRAVSSAGAGAVGRGAVTYSAPYVVHRELRSDQGASTSAKAQENATEALRTLRASILAAGVACTDWNERVISVYATPDGSWHIFAGIVSGVCKY